MAGLKILSATLSGENAERFSLSGFQNGLISASESEFLQIILQGDENALTTLTLKTDHLAENGLGTQGESFVFNLAQIPEPSSVMLALLGLLPLLRRKRP